MILYVGVAMAAVGSTSLEEYGTSTTLVFAARNLFPTWLFYFFIIGGPIMALLSTLNSSFAYNSINIGASCDDGWLPKFFGKKNSKGARVYVLTFMYVVGMIPIVLGLSITVITNMVQLIGACWAFLNFIAFINLPKKFPKAWAQSRFHIPNGLYYVICCVSLAGFVITFWKSCLSMSSNLAIVNVVMIIALACVGLIRGKTADINIQTSIWGADNTETIQEQSNT
jgi:APA family basic amino acid/polyamine antiporter